MAKRILYTGKVTGTSYYLGWEAKHGKMNVGDLVGLKRDRTNPYDSRATAVMYEGVQIGWVPKALNHKVAAAIDNSDTELEAVITKVNHQGGFEDRLYITITSGAEDAVVNADYTKLEARVLAQKYAFEQCARDVDTLLDTQTYDTVLKTFSESKEYRMSQIDQVIDKNKQTAVSAAFMEAGRIANNQVAKIASKQLPVMLRGYADTALGKLVLANAANFAAQKLRPQDQRLGKLTGAMMVQAYQELYADFDIEQMIEDLLENSTIKKALKTVDAELPKATK